jgi:hypothetical protein
VTKTLPAEQPIEVRKLHLKLRGIAMKEKADQLASDLTRFAARCYIGPVCKID